jgi:HK97 family phage major capsid protein
MVDLLEVKRIIEEQGHQWEEFRKANDSRLNNLEDAARIAQDFMLKESSPFSKSSQVIAVPGNGGAPFAIKMSDGSVVPVLSKSERCVNHFQKKADEEFSIADHVRHNMLGTKSASSSALVPTGVLGMVIDNVRAQSTVIRAGAGTVIIDGPTNLAKITGDPTVYEHTEATADITESDITLAPVSLNPKALVALIPLSMEVVADSPNLDAVLNTSLAAAFAAKLDSLAIATILADANIPTSSVGQDPSIWLQCLNAIGEAMEADQPIPASLISNASDFISRASQLASTGGNWLGNPPVLTGMQEYPTTKVSAGTAIYGGFESGFAIALRQELRLEVVRFGKPTSATHLLVAHMRGAGVVLQPKRLFIQQKTV